ncbi:MAG: TniB family NTP-binding protein [Arenimonas sp.]
MTAQKFPHLLPATMKAMLLPKEERIEHCQSDHWIGYTRGTNVLRQLNELMSHPRTKRMPNVLVVGRSGNGKTSVLEEFSNRYPIQSDMQGRAIVPILLIEMPDTPTESEFWSTILWSLNISHREHDPPRIKKRQARTLMLQFKIRVLVIDEFNNLTRAGKEAGAILAAIKGLSNILKISIVAAGTSEAVNALNSEPQMKSRFEPAVLDRWTLNVEYLRFLASYEKVMPLAEPSDIAGRELGTRIFVMAGDTVGGMVKVLKKASAIAIRTGAEKITSTLLDDMEWTRPDQWHEVGSRV